MEIQLFAAIAEMKRLTAINQPFSFSFASWDSTRRTSKGIVMVNRALLATRETYTSNANAEHMLSYRSLDDDKIRRCWQPCIMYFNGKKVVI
jgi:hypothetical protein